MYKGTSASAGIGIGKAVIVEEAQRNWQRTWQPGWERRKRKSCRDI